MQPPLQLLDGERGPRGHTADRLQHDGDLGAAPVAEVEAFEVATKADGRGVRTYCELEDGSAGLVGDGSTSPCGSRNMPSRIVWIAVCAGPDGADSECEF